LAAKLLRDPQGHTVQPRADAAIELKRMGPSGEDEKHRLEGVVGIVPISQNSQARSVHEGAVSADEGRKRVLVAFTQKPGCFVESFW
jgi:hypothetical protein